MLFAPMSAAVLPPPISWHQIGAIRIDYASALLVIAAFLYGLGVWRLNKLEPARRWSRRRTFAFFFGLVVTFVAVESIIGIYDGVLFYDHMIQHLLLVMVAAPLFAMGAPLELLERSTTGRSHRIVESVLHSAPVELLLHPLTGFGLYAVTIPLTHLTSLYNLTLTNEPVHDLEHLLFLVVGYLFWRHPVGIEASRHPLHPGLRLLFLIGAVPIDTFTGVALTTTTHELFPAYLALHRTWGPSLLTDLHAGGAIMWVGGDSLMGIGMAPVAIQWVRHEELRTYQIDQELDREEMGSAAPTGNGSGPIGDGVRVPGRVSMHEEPSEGGGAA